MFQGLDSFILSVLAFCWCASLETSDVTPFLSTQTSKVYVTPVKLNQVEHPSVKYQDNWSSAHNLSKPTLNLTCMPWYLLPVTLPFPVWGSQERAAWKVAGPRNLYSQPLSMDPPFLLCPTSPHNPSAYKEERDLQDLRLFFNHYLANLRFISLIWHP